MDKKQFINSALIYAVNAIFIAGIGFISLPILTSLLTKEDFGVISIFTATILMLIPILGSNSNMVFVQQYFKINDLERSKFISSVLLITLISVSFFVLMSPIFLFWENILEIPSFAFALALICSSLLIFNSTLNSFWQVTNDAKSYLIYNSSKAFFTLLFTIVFLILIESSWVINILVIFVLEIIYFFISIYYIKNRFNLNWKNSSYIKTIYKIGLPYLPSSFGSWIFTMGDRYLIAYFLGLPALGLYEIANKIGGSIRIIDTSISRTWGAYFYQKINMLQSDPAVFKNIFKLLFIISFLLFALSTFYFWGSKFILKYLVANEFQSAYNLIGWFAVNYILFGIFEKLNNFIINTGKTYISSIFISILALLKLLFNYYMISSYGLLGALYGNFIINLILCLITLIVIFNLKEYNLKLVFK